MKKHLWTLSIPLLLAIILTGCGSAGGGNLAPTAAAVRPLNATEWPTPPPATPPDSPTPFPKITLEPTPTAAPAPTATPDALASNTLSPNDATDPPPSQTSAAESGLTPVVVGLVTADKATIRREPDGSYGAIGVVTQGELAAVFGKNSAGDWLYLLTGSELQGWLPTNSVRVTGTLDKAPVLPANPVARPSAASAPATPTASHSAANLTPAKQSGATGQTASGLTVIRVAAKDMASSPITAVANDPPPATNDLTPLATARIKINQVDVRPAPSTDAAPIATITDNQENITILGLDKSRSWALVKPAFTNLGWVALSDLTVNGSLTGAPQIFTAWVESNEVQIRRGPGTYQDMVGILAINSLIRVVGLDETQSWALVKPIPGGGQGWVPTQFIKLDTRVADLPVVKAEGGPAPANTEGGAAPMVNSRVPIVNSQPHLVFQLSSGGDIMVINPDGTGLRRLTQGIDPVLSPDGKTVAFTRWQGETGSLWLINIDGTNERQLLGFIKQAKGPDWSPDNSKIVLNFQHEGRLDNQTDCFKLTKGKKPPSPPQNAFHVGVRKNDKGVFFCWTLPPDPHWGLRVVNVADGKFQDLYGGQYAFRPAWDPTQAWRVVADAGNGLIETDVTRDYHHNLTDRIEDGSPVFSPDGRYLAVTDGQQGGNQGYDIFRLNRDGSGRVRLTQTPLWVPVTPGDHKLWNNVSPAWSPDGSQIAFLTDWTGRWEIWTMNIDGSNPHPMFSDVVNNQLQLSYNFVDERVLSWR